MELSPSVRSTLTAIAEVCIPAGARLPAGGEATVRELERALAHVPRSVSIALSALARTADLLALREGRRHLAFVAPARRLALLEAWRTSRSYRARLAFRALAAALKGAHCASASVQERSGARLLDTVIHEAEPRWMQQIQDLGVSGPDDELEADVVIIGSGAGGAIAARELATRGVAVVVLEAGPLHRRDHFVGSIIGRSSTMYSSLGLQYTVGNASIFLPTGETVGGTTVINAGTCLRTPPWILRHWRETQGVAFEDHELDAHFERVEAWLDVGVSDEVMLGVPAKVIAKGADALGIAHGPLTRNAPGCDAQSTCCFGCPSGAKRSADLAFLPRALESGAVLFTNARVGRVDREGADQVVEASSPAGRKVKVRAQHVIFAAGALRTPLLLRASGLRHPWLGRNLSIHPAVGALAVLPFDVNMDRAVPQGYGLEGLREQGLLFESAGLPFEVAGISLQQIGSRYVELLEQYQRMMVFGFNVRDTSRGRVVRGPGGKPIPLYHVNRADLAQLAFGTRVLLDLLFAGGATSVLPGLSFADEVFPSMGSRVLDGHALRASDFELQGYHPLGTARMGDDAATSVVDMNNVVRSEPGWLVCDGSAVPTSIGANPQVTIMALSLRAAGRLAERLGC